MNHSCSENRLSKIFFSNPFPKKRSDCESQKSGFGFDPKNPPRESWIHDSFLDLPPKTQNPFLDFPKTERCDAITVSMETVMIMLLIVSKSK